MTINYRPPSWDNYIGQTKLKNRLRIHARAAESRSEPMPHILLIGPPGCGKTTLGQLIANDTGTQFASFVMPMNDMLLNSVIEEFQGVLLLDEIHRCPPKQQERLLPLIEDGYLQQPTGSRIYSNNLTVVAATTEGDKVIKPLYDRFPIRPLFDEYTDEEMTSILRQFAKNSFTELSDNTIEQLAPATLGVPRHAKAFIQMAEDLAIEYGREPTAREILQEMRVTTTGLTAEHVRYCEMLATAGGNAGLDLMKTLLGLPARAVEDLEIDLIKQGMVERQKSGRVLTAKGSRLSTNRRPRLSFLQGEQND